MSMEGTREEAYFASKEGVQCLTLVSSSSEKSLSIFGEKLGRLVGWEKEGEREEVMRVHSRLQSGLIPQ